ncbi:MAG: endonuclease/exonuclease/phosphatase family protein [Phycisphaeraceae bacterium]|nr:endonuclease/exonuclease/phosphatase family protein [Phycisphaeraceae bacterium]
MPDPNDTPRTLRMLAWNILHGGSGRRLPHIALEIVSHEPDLVVISEFRPTLGGQLLAILADRGLVHVAEASGGLTQTRNRIIMVSRFGFEPDTELMREEPPESLRRRVVVRRLAREAGGLIVTGAHLPDDWIPSSALHGWAWLVDHAIRFRGDRHVILGDLNGSRDPGQPGGPPRHVAFGMGRLATAGYIDVFAASETEPSEKSARHTTWKSHWGHELRLDHAIVSGCVSSAIRRAEYMHEPRISGVSDHSAVLLELSVELEKTGPEQ